MLDEHGPPACTHSKHLKLFRQHSQSSTMKPFTFFFLCHFTQKRPSVKKTQSTKAIKINGETPAGSGQFYATEQRNGFIITSLVFQKTGIKPQIFREQIFFLLESFILISSYWCKKVRHFAVWDKNYKKATLEKAKWW